MIEQLLKEIKEDKCDNLGTTSYEFKRDVWNYFKGFENKVAVEFGTHKGQTTRILSFLFNKVYTVNINNNESAKSLNADRNNIIYIDNFNLYSTRLLPIEEPVSMFLIDAGHNYSEVISDINRSCSMNCDQDCYIVFDDYGLAQYEFEVKKAVDEALNIQALTLIKGIGHTAGHNFGGTPPRILQNHEGLITKINWH
jgi:hypothetical protein